VSRAGQVADNRNVGDAANPLKRGDSSLQPWQFFVLAALTCATIVTFVVRGQGIGVVVLLTIVMGTAALVGLAVLRTVRPLVTSQEERTVMIGSRTRAALEREKMLALRALKELEFDHAMGKVADDDFQELTSKLRARAIRLMRQLDAGTSYREQIERELATRLKATPTIRSRACPSCSTTNDPDAKFCKQCGTAL
jgi:hypothetical protein